MPAPDTDRIMLADHPLSPYAQKVRIILREKGLPFDVETRGNGGGTLLSLNPRSEVPVLIHEGHAIFDSTIIAEYIEERFPSPALMPADPAMRARARAIEDVGDTQWEAVNWGVMEVRFFGRGEGALGEALVETARRDVAALYGWLEQELGVAAWLSGEAFGWADAAIVPYVAMSILLDMPIACGSRLEAWSSRCMAHPTVAETIEEARVALPLMSDVGRLLQKSGFKRQYRDHRLEWMLRAGGLDVVAQGLAHDNIRFTDLNRFATV